MIVADDLTVEIAPGADLSADPSTWTWVDISTKVRHADGIGITGVGRGDESASADTPELAIRVENDTGDFSSKNPLGQWFPDLGVGTPIRVYWNTVSTIRFAGHITELPPRWSGDKSGSDATAIIHASGITRRMQQGEQALESALKRSVPSEPDLVAWWPMEDGSDTTEFATGLNGDTSPMTFTGDVSPASEGAAGSLPLPSFRPGSTFSAPISAPLTEWHAACLFRTESALSSGFVFPIDIRVSPNPEDPIGGIRAGFDNDEARIIVLNWDVGFAPFADVSEPYVLPVGEFVLVQLFTFNFAGSFVVDLRVTHLDGTEFEMETGTISDRRAGSPTRALLRTTTVPDSINVGHFVVTSGRRFQVDQVDIDAVNGYAGEEAADRYARLCAEEGVRFDMHGSAGPALSLLGRLDDYASTPSDPSFELTDDLDMRALIAPHGPLDQTVSILDKSGDGTTGDITYEWRIEVDGRLTVEIADGIIYVPNTSTEPVPGLFNRSEPIAVRMTAEFTPDETITFYTGDSIDGPWTQLGEALVDALIGDPPFNQSVPLIVGSSLQDDVGNRGFKGLIMAAQIRNGIDGTVIANPDFAAQPPLTREFTDSTGKVWTLNGGASIPTSAAFPGETPTMGVQLLGTLTANLQDCADVDPRSIFHESDRGLTYRTGASKDNQPFALTVSQTNGELSRPPEPTDDDQAVRNDVTVERVNGSSSRVIDQQHIDDHGRYDEKVTVNVEADSQTLQNAAWRLGRGTVDEYRWPRINLALHQDPELIADWLTVRVGDRLSIEHDIPEIVGVDVDLIIEGWSERFDQFRWDVELNCSPASPFSVWQLEPDPGSPAEDQRLATAGATLGAAITDSATSFDVVSTGQPWINSTDHAAMFPFSIVVGGEEVRVDSITGAASPQTFGVTRSINSVVKSHDAGADVQVAEPIKAAL